MPRVVIENLTKIFKGPWGEEICAVNHASLSVGTGEFLVLVGPSGCGKTTTLRLIAGLEQITQGTISVDGKIINDVPPKDRDIAMVFQNHALYPHMTARENLAFGLKLRKTPKAEIERRISEAAEILGLKDCLDRKPQELSGGQRQRVSLGRALARQPKVFLFDEPLSNLDAILRAQMRREILKLHARLGSTMIYVTHDQAEAMAMGDRIAVMREGTIQQASDPLKLYHCPANLFVAGFFGSPPMNFFRGTILKTEKGLYFQAQSGAAADWTFTMGVEDKMAAALADYAGRSVVFGIRPENIADRNNASDAAPGWTVEAVVERVEPLGAETHLHLAGGGHTFVARFSAMEQRIEAPRKMTLVFDMRKAHFFDAETEKTIV
jgi:multiple sugar transport system ATP-binding protein